MGIHESHGGPKLAAKHTDTDVCEIKAAGPQKKIGFAGIDVTKSYKLTSFADTDAPKP